MFTKDLPIDSDYPESCVYWIYHEDKHTDPRNSGYVGVCVHGSDKRFKQHWSDANNGSNLIVHKAMRKYGGSVKIKTLLKADPELCLLTEALLRPKANVPGLWNINAGGEKTRQGASVSDETKAILRAANLGKKYSQKTKDLLSAQRKGRVVSDQTKLRMSEAAKGRVITEDHRNKIAKSRAKTVEKIPSWERGVAQQNHTIWLQADAIYNAKQHNTSYGAKRVAELFGLKEWNIRYLWKKLKNGWIPTEDESWLKFKISKEEAENVTQTTPSP